MTTSASVGTDLYPHMPILCPAHALDESARTWAMHASHLASARGPHAGQFIQFSVSDGPNLTKMGYSLPCTSMNRRAKFDAASFILGGKICKQKKNQKQ